ncbi:MAG: LamG domain-containing protein [Candidatus Korarchaeum sp.]
MNEAISLLLIGFMIVLLLSFTFVAQLVLQIYLINARNAMGSARERVKELIEDIWIAPYDLVLYNEGGRDSVISYLYVYLNGSSVPIQLDLGNEFLKAQGYRHLRFQEVASKFERSSYGYVRFYSRDGSAFFRDPFFPLGDTLELGANRYSLRRGASSGDAVATVNLGSSGTWTFCAWVKLDSTPSVSFDILRAGDHIRIFYDGNSKSLKAGVGSSTLSSINNPTRWNHVCVVLDGTRAHYYVNGTLSASIPFTSALSVNQLKAVGTGFSYWVDDIYVAATPMSERDLRRLAATSSSERGLLFTFDRLCTTVSRVDLITDSGGIQRFENPYETQITFPEPQVTPIPRSGAISVDLGGVLISGYLPLSLTGDYSGLYLMMDNGYARYWNGSGYGMGVKLVYDPSSDRTYVESGGGRGIQVVTVPELLLKTRDVEAKVGEGMQLTLIRVDDGFTLRVSFTPQTISVYGLSKLGNRVVGRVFWAQGGAFQPRADCENLTVVALETGDQAKLRGDGSFELMLSSNLSTIRVALFLPDCMPILRGYMVPLSGIYAVGG